MSDSFKKDGLIKYELTAQPYLYGGEDACGWHFVSFPKDLTKEIRGNHKHQEEGWGRMKATVYQAIYVPEGVETPPRSVINDPEIIVYIKDFGTQSGDLGVVAEQNGQVVGAAWTRIIPACGSLILAHQEVQI